jgi:hypothetical protein
MNTQEENNRLIVDFMEIKPLESNGEYTWSDSPYYFVRYKEKEKTMVAISEYAKYHTSWDWLMPVVEKINLINNEIFGVTINGNKTTIEDCFGINELCIESDKNFSMILNTYDAVIEFIKWNNKNQTFQ